MYIVKSIPTVSAGTILQVSGSPRLTIVGGFQDI